MKKILTLALALIMVFALCACGQTAAAPEAAPAAEAKTALILGTSADYGPFEFMYPNDKGEMVYGGIDVSVAQYIADDMGLELQVENMAFDYLLAALSKGDYDIVIAAMEATDERKESADFSDPYFTDQPAKIVVKKDVADQYATLADFAGKVVGAQTATTKLNMVYDEIPDATAQPLQNVNDLVNELVNDKIDAVLLDGAVAMKFVETNPDLALAAASDELPEPQPYCIAVQKGDPKGLLPSLNSAIAKMLAENATAQFVEDASALGDVAEYVSVDAPAA